MAHTAHKDPEMVKEWEEDEQSLIKKAETVAEWIKQSKHMICFTGAGVSTSAGIPDFRGPQGVWTLRAQGKERTGPTTSTLKAIPTPTHMSIVALQRYGICKYLVSQNTDGLHRRSGIEPDKLSELHGNSNLEMCRKCGKQYLRDFRVRSASGVHDHETDRYCAVKNCGGRLYDTIINFGENLPEEPLHKALVNADKGNFCLSLGSSLTVSPANKIPEIVAERGKLVIVNLQKTPLDSVAAMKVHAKCDKFMQLVMKNLEIEIPEWRLRRRMQITVDRVNKPGKKYLDVAFQGVDVDGIPVSFMKNLQVATTENASKKKVNPSKKDDTIFHYKIDLASVLESPLSVHLQANLEFMGHYLEPSLDMDVSWNISLTQPVPPRVFILEYNPFQRVWKVTEDGSEVAVKQETQEEPSNSNSNSTSAWWQIWK